MEISELEPLIKENINNVTKIDKKHVYIFEMNMKGLEYNNFKTYANTLGKILRKRHIKYIIVPKGTFDVYELNK